MNQSMSRVQSSPALPVWRQAEEYLKKLILSGELQPGQRLPNHQELYQQLRVSSATLQRALSSLAQQGLVERRPRVGTIVAEVLPVRATTLAVMVRALFDPSSNNADALLGKAIVTHLQEHEETFRFYHAPFIPNAPEETLHRIDPALRRDVEEGLVKGLLVAGCIPVRHRDFRTKLEQLAIPVVEMSAFVDNDSFAVVPDFADLAQQAAGILARNGRRRVGVIQLVEPVVGQTGLSDFRPAALRRAFAEQGLKTADCWWQCPPVGTEINGHDAMRRLWEQDNRPDGLVITDDVLATGAIIALLELGVHLPDDLFVVVQSNKGSFRLFPHSMVQLQMDVDAWVARAVQMLFDRLEGRRLPKRRVAIPFTEVNMSET